MEIRQLQYFVEVARCLNFTKAAAALFTGQSNLSQQIANLEDQLGVQLLQRNTRSISLTSAGIVFYEEAKKVLVQLGIAENSVKCMSMHEIPGKLRIGLEPGFEKAPVIHKLISKTLYQMKRTYCNLHTSFQSFPLGELDHAILRGTVDIGLRKRPCQQLAN